MGEAADALARHRDPLVERFADVLDKAIAQAVRGGHAAVIQPAAAGPLRFDQLELMDDAQLQGVVDTARMHQPRRAANVSLVRLIPKLLATLRQGLAKVGRLST